MAIGLLGIASGALKIGQKIFAGVKKRREAKIEKKAQNLVDAQDKLAAQVAKFGGFGLVDVASSDKLDVMKSIKSFINPDQGTMAVSGAANALNTIKGGGESIMPTAANVALQERTSKGGFNFDFKNPIVLVGIALLGFLLIKKLK